MRKANLVVEKFDSIEVFTKTIMGRKPNKVFAGITLSSDERGESFSGTGSLVEALNVMKNGYVDPLDKIKKSMNSVQVKSNTPVAKVRPTVGVVGFAPCVPNAIMGLPNSMIAVERVPMKSKVLTIMYSIGVNWKVPQREIIDAGTAVLKMINDLELKGYRVKLTVELLGTASGNEFASCTVNVKDWRQHLDLKKLTFPLVHPSALRRVGLRWLETTPNLTQYGYTGGYGTPKANDGYESAKRFYEEQGILDKNTYYINIPMVRDCNYDTQRMLQKCGMAQVVKKGA